MPIGLSLMVLIAFGLGDDDRPGADVPALRQHALSHKGDPAHGKTLFGTLKPVACATCHRVRGEGGDIGPDLSAIAGKFDRPHLIESILEPSRQIVEGYRITIVATKAGQVLRGIVRTESADELTLVDAEGKRHVVATADIEERGLGTFSLMPEGLAGKVSAPDFTDLVAYLETLRPSHAPTPGEHVSGSLTLPDGFTSRRVAVDLTGATAMEIAPDGRIFVCEQTGTLRVVKRDKLLAEPFVTLKVDSQWERGLIGVTIDPEFEKNSYVYLCTVVPDPYPHHRIVRLTADGDRAKPGSELVLLEGDDQSKMGGSVPAGHQGGALHFGRDGKLYASIGEQTAGAPAQDLHSLLGKLLRLNPDGSIPTDNPFYDRTEGKYRAIWAYGLRNPFTFAVQPGSGRIFINDVGQDKWEEVNEGFAGANYGWPTSEGQTHDSRFRAPIHVYPVASVAGGAFVPEHLRWPERFHGRYLFMDFVHGWIKVLGPAKPAEATPFVSGLTRPVDLRFAPDGSLYVLLRDAWVIDREFQPRTGSLIKIQYQPEAAAKAVRP
ncbi:MAG TPA: PQQ-dependent sugar dehydrogenase [Isosphaeraceae bacterium]|jgi:putative heme-binding domain-containing protein|nr:PQQ-dependent sugar dehydrogenase [Isosphaeraceae bacterium]